MEIVSIGLVTLAGLIAVPGIILLAFWLKDVGVESENKDKPMIKQKPTTQRKKIRPLSKRTKGFKKATEYFRTFFFGLSYVVG